ncbi:MAG TPA: hypothetical protein VE033_03810 [Acetobacteraceae bacterium]|nr:hypothetical protein [Acetobacteraceae bacterium]
MTTRLPSITDPPDSLFTWVFHAEGGDSWGGWLVDNTGRYAVGASLAAARGTYVIVAAEDQAQDLSLHGLEEGQVFVAWYRDAGLGQFLPTRNGGATPSGTGGLGTEQDAAWNGEGWDAFGLGGADLADAVERPDSLFAWVFASDAGDTLWGTLHADSADHAPGDTVRGAAGTYRILEETPYGRDTGLAEGTVTTTRYLDGASRLHLALESAGLVATGLAGLGSEFDRAAGAVQAGTAGGGPAAAQVGLAGLRQADRQPDVRFTYRFQADEGGDSWTGWLIGHAPALQPGAVIVTAHGRYTITAADPWSGPATLDGSVWITSYLDAQTGRVLATQAWDGREERTGTLGLGSERDLVWDGDGWDPVGLGGLLQAQVEPGTAFVRAPATDLLGA